VHYRVLGPLEVRDGGHVIGLPGRKHRELLALLLARANQVVSVDHLLARLWPGHSPVRAKAALQVYVSELRRTLQPGRPARSRDNILMTHPPGYRLAVAVGTLDAQEFDDLVHRARQACVAGSLERGAALLRDALSLWRGPVLADLSMDELDSNLVTRLHEARLQAFEDLIEVELRLGHHGVVIADLAGLAAEHPYRERLHGQLMVALYRCGRQADALEVYRDLRTRLAGELGIEPGDAQRRVHQAILCGVSDELLPPLSATASGPVSATSPGGDDRHRSSGPEPSQPIPAQLPGDTELFIGRQAELDQMLEYLAKAGTATPKVCAISGAGGIGKSALAIHAAHVLRPRFPDGQLYVNLHGATVGLEPVTPVEALGGWLRALGLDPASVPADTDEAAARFRSLLAGRRVLVVCDDAVDAAQVRPLLPAGGGCLTLVTSRRVLATLDNAIHIRLDVLSEQEAVAVLERLAGTQRITAEPLAAAEVARLCDYVPLAVRIAGAKLATHPDRSIGVLAGDLADERYRLDELQVSDMSLRSSLAVSYHDLRRDPAGHQAARMWRLLGLNPGPDFGPDAAAALAGTAPRTARQLLDLLAEVHLIEHAGHGRYRLHDLLRIYAAERVTEEPDQDRAMALDRLLHWYLHTAAVTSTLRRA
jgi:DNA-binding SARP family transcriptional activator